MPIVRTVDGSSNIASIGYDPATGELRVGFHNGGFYLYETVPGEVHRAFLEAPSKGAYLAKHLKGQYVGHKVDAQFDVEASPEELNKDELYRQSLAKHLNAMQPPTPSVLAEMIGVTASEVSPGIFRFVGHVQPDERVWLERYRSPGHLYEFE